MTATKHEIVDTLTRAFHEQGCGISHETIVGLIHPRCFAEYVSALEDRDFNYSIAGEQGPVRFMGAILLPHWGVRVVQFVTLTKLYSRLGVL